MLHPKRTRRLWNFFLSHFEPKRVVKSILVAIPLIALGTWLLSYEVSRQDIPSVWARWLNLPIITLLSYALNRQIVWSDGETTWWHGLRRYTVVSVAHASATWTVFTLLVTVAGLGHAYLYVNLLLIVVFCPASYLLYKLWICVVKLGVRMTVTA